MDNKAKLYTKILAAQKAIGYVKKNGKNTFNNYNYAMEADILDEVKSAANEAGLVLITSASSTLGSFTNPKGEYIRTADIILSYSVIDAETGESIEGCFPGYAEDKGDKAVYKAITGASKYFLMKFFGVATGDDPEKDEAQQPKQQKQYNQPVANMNTPEQQANFKAEKQALIEEIKKHRDHAKLSPEQVSQLVGFKYSARDSIDTLTTVNEALIDFIERFVTNRLTEQDLTILKEGQAA